MLCADPDPCWGTQLAQRVVACISAPTGSEAPRPLSKGQNAQSSAATLPLILHVWKPQDKMTCLLPVILYCESPIRGQRGMNLTCTQTLLPPAGGTAGSSRRGAFGTACSGLPLLSLLAKVQLFLPAGPLTSALSPSVTAFCCAVKQFCQRGRGGVLGFAVVSPNAEEESSVAEVGGRPACPPGEKVRKSGLRQ